MIYGWDHSLTAARYERFCERHARYDDANRHLIERAEIAAGHSVLDIAAGTGRTAEPALAAGAEVVCWEPAAAMRAAGERRVPGAVWTADLPDRRFDRVLCGAAAWQWQPFSTFVRMAEHRLRPGGALVFNVPALYLGVPDEPGGGRDPLLLELASRLTGGAAPRAQPVSSPASISSVEASLADAGFRSERWSFRLRISQESLVDWYRIPVLTDALLGDLDASARDARLSQACQDLDYGSWKWEGWLGWTAWKR